MFSQYLKAFQSFLVRRKATASSCQLDKESIYKVYRLFMCVGLPKPAESRLRREFWLHFSLVLSFVQAKERTFLPDSQTKHNSSCRPCFAEASQRQVGRDSTIFI